MTVGETRPTTLMELLDHASASESTGLRLLDRRERETFVSWHDLRVQALKVGGALQARGLQPGDRVGLIFPTGLGFFTSFFGVLAAGGIPAPLYPPVRLGRLDEYHARSARMLDAIQARMVLTDKKVHRVIGEVIEAARPELGCVRVEDLDEASPADFMPTPEALGLIQYSSGTTRDPAPVALSHRALIAQASVVLDGIVDTFPLEEVGAHAGASWLPLYHDMGLIGTVMPSMLHRANLALIGPEVFVARPAVWLRMVSRYGATVSPAPNFAYALCVDRIRDEELEGVDLSCWRLALNGAEAVAPRVLDQFCDRFAPWGFRREALTPVYGLSEASLAVSFSEMRSEATELRLDRDRLELEGVAEVREDGDRWSSVGRPLHGFDVEIRNAGDVLEEGHVGRLWVRGPSLMDGYYGQPERTKETLVEGWLDTGDRAFLHDGELYIVGRDKDVLIVRGRNIAPAILEDFVDSVEGVRVGCSAAVSISNPDGATEGIRLFVECRKDAGAVVQDAMPDACKAAVLQGIGVHIDDVVVLKAGTLPRTSSGKIRRSETRTRWEAGSLQPPDRVTPLRMVGVTWRSARAHRQAKDA